MKIEKIKYSNFFSSGKSPVEIDISKTNRTLVIGENGAGKSTLLDSICFGLFGETYKTINKPKIVNSINKKNCLVEIWFTKKSQTYYIKRGIKPNVFEIYKNDKLLPVTNVREYQKMLEDEILQVNYTTFKQIAIIGKSGFTPFMQLKPNDRKSIIENILDLGVFSTMNQLLKERIFSNKEDISNKENELYKFRSDVQTTLDKINFLKAEKEQEEENNLAVEKERSENIEKIKTIIEKLDTKIDNIDIKLEGYNGYSGQERTLLTEHATLNTNKKKIYSELKFYKDNSNCPTCKQDIDNKFKKTLVSDSHTAYTELQTNIEKIKLEQEELRIKLDEQNDMISSKNELVNKKSVLSGKLQTLENEQSKPKNVTVSQDKINSLMVDLQGHEKLVIENEEELSGYLRNRELYKVSSKLLKDDGIKSSIIKKYIPLINKYINYYLDLFSFNVQFEIDENFNEVIKSRHRDAFSYENFSEGEKARIDLALLFTWRAIAKSRNSTDINFLAFDEVTSGSLDDDGEDDLAKILKTFENTNIMVITHSDKVKESKIFARTLYFEKRNNFSQYEEMFD